MLHDCGRFTNFHIRFFLEASNFSLIAAFHNSLSVPDRASLTLEGSLSSFHSCIRDEIGKLFSLAIFQRITSLI